MQEVRGECGEYIQMRRERQERGRERRRDYEGGVAGAVAASGLMAEMRAGIIPSLEAIPARSVSLMLRYRARLSAASS